MLSFYEARKRCLAIKIKKPKIVLTLAEANGRYLAEDLHAPQNQPLWDNSAMDGYAVHADSIGSNSRELKVIEEIPAGTMPQKTINGIQMHFILFSYP